MKSQEFCYWLQGFFEIHGKDEVELSSSQIEIIKNHLALVFKHEIGPSYSASAKVQGEMNRIHSGSDKPNIPIKIGGKDEFGNSYRC